ncbi:MAG TPA: endolytic transglycosylase MltG [Puia sp.]|jgi:UPF0755 protein|nr:endolytic transglycosylase MltG [Puia sp.]
MKRFFLALLIVLLFALGFVAWRILGSGTAFSGDSYALYVRTGMTYDQLRNLLIKDTVIESPAFFDWVAARMDYPANIKAGKYEIRKDMSILGILRMLRNGRQTPVHLVILKFRTLEGLAGAVGRKFECDSDGIAAFIHNDDSLRPFGVDSNTLLTIVMPNTYSYFWNTPPSAIFKKMYSNYKAWWTPDRVRQAAGKGLTPATATILASIVEEETNAQSDKGKIASVYLNRMQKRIKLGADPTVKYALRDFELKRIYDKDLKVESPYNTYLHDGLPPGPICTPSSQTLDAVLDAPATNYLYFVAKPDNSGYSNFATTYKEHMQNAKAYQDWLDRQYAIRAHADSLKKK